MKLLALPSKFVLKTFFGSLNQYLDMKNSVTPKTDLTSNLGWTTNVLVGLNYEWIQNRIQLYIIRSVFTSNYT